MWKTRILAPLIAGLVTFSLALTVNAPADAAPAVAKHGSLSAFRSWMVGKQTIPTKYTNYQYVKMTGSHQIYANGCPTGVYQPDDEVYSQLAAIPGAASPATLTATHSAAPDCTFGVGPDGQVQPNSWWNPSSWNWGAILGDTWDRIWNGCIKGAASGVVGTASGTLIVNLMTRGAKIFIGPEGYAALAVGGCVVGLVFG